MGCVLILRCHIAVTLPVAAIPGCSTGCFTGRSTGAAILAASPRSSLPLPCPLAAARDRALAHPPTLACRPELVLDLRLDPSYRYDSSHRLLTTCPSLAAPAGHLRLVGLRHLRAVFGE